MSTRRNPLIQLRRLRKKNRLLKQQNLRAIQQVFAAYEELSKTQKAVRNAEEKTAFYRDKFTQVLQFRFLRLPEEQSVLQVSIRLDLREVRLLDPEDYCRDIANRMALRLLYYIQSNQELK